MSNDPITCEAKTGVLKCSYGHDLIHRSYFDEEVAKRQSVETRLATVTQDNARLQAIINEQERPTLNHMLIEQKYGNVQITLRGKTKLFTPHALLDMIRTLKQMYNHAKSYSGPVMVHCTNGIEEKAI